MYKKVRHQDANINSSGFLWPEEVKLVEHLFLVHEKAFAWDETEKGMFGEAWFDPIVIPTIEHVPWALRNIPIPPGIHDEVVKIIRQKIRSNVYEPSNSSYRSRWFCVLKKDGKSLRIVHNLEPLNAVTIQDVGVPPMVEHLAESFACRAVYGLFDLFVSFDQRSLDSVSRDLTTFQTPLGTYRLTCIPMGYTNSVQIMQGDVSHILQDEIPHITIPFIDDVPVKGPPTRYETSDGGYETIPENSGIRRFIWEHLYNVNRVLQRVKAYGGTFNGKKSFLCVPEITVVGHKCTYEGRVPDESKVQKIRDWPNCVSVTEVRGFLGTCGIVRIFIRDFAKIVRPLVLLTRKDVEFGFGEEEEEAMNIIKNAIIQSPALRPIDYASGRTVVLAVDSSNIAVGFALFQIGDDRKRYPNRFGSITWNDRESRYSQAKLELYGLFRALRATRIYIVGVKDLQVEVDAKYIKGMINNPDIQPNATINRWIAGILLFHFTLLHVPASRHTGVDGLSRRPLATEDPVENDDFEEWIDTANAFTFANYLPPRLTAAYACFGTRSPSKVPASASILYALPDPPPHFHSSHLILLSETLPAIPRSLKARNQDEVLDRISDFLKTLQRPPNLSDAEYRSFIKQAQRFFLQNEILWQRHQNQPRIVPHRDRRYGLISEAHDGLGHKGFYVVRCRLQDRFWWPKMDEDVKWYLRTCHECQVRKTQYFHIPPTVPIPASLFRKAHIDSMYMPVANKFRYIVHARDSLTAWPEFRALRKESAATIGDFIFEEILCRWGALEELVTDNGSPYVAAVEYLAKKYHIHHIRISGYNSQANGLVENRHFHVRESIMKAVEGDETKWYTAIHHVLWAERVTIQRSTGYSPYFMVHGVEPLLPFDISEATYLLPALDVSSSHSELVAYRAKQLMKRPEDLRKLHESIDHARHIFLRQFEKANAARIVDFDFQPGRLVLVRNSRTEMELSRKAKPRYLGPMVVLRRTRGGSYILGEVDGAVSKLRYAAFRVIPYHARSRTLLSVTELTKLSPEELETMTHEPPREENSSD